MNLDSTATMDNPRPPEMRGEWNGDKSGWVGPYDTDYF